MVDWGNLRCLIPGYCCSICYAIFSVWGFVVLIVVGLALSADYRKIDYETLDHDKVSSVALQTYIAAAIYFACIVGCGARFIYLYNQDKKLQREKMMRHMQAGEAD